MTPSFKHRGWVNYGVSLKKSYFFDISGKLVLPHLGLEAGEGDFAVDEEWAFHEIPVGGEQGDGPVLGHRRQLVLESELAIVVAGGIEESAELAVVTPEGGFQFGGSGRGLADRLDFVVEAHLFQPLHGLAAAVAISVNVNRAHGGSC